MKGVGAVLATGMSDTRAVENQVVWIWFTKGFIHNVEVPIGDGVRGYIPDSRIGGGLRSGLTEVKLICNNFKVLVSREKEG